MRTGAAWRRIAVRGFGVAEIQRGIAAVVSERDAERAQLRADASVVAKRRRQVMSSLVLLAASYAIDWYVREYQRVPLKPGWYGVKTPGAILFYVAAVTRGLTMISLLNSPLRRSPVGWLFGWFWTGVPGRWLLTRISRSVPVSGSGGRTTESAIAQAVRRPSKPPLVSQAPQIAPGDPLPTQVQRLEERVAALEQWRNRGNAP
jgi:hypothetical protein